MKGARPAGQGDDGLGVHDVLVDVVEDDDVHRIVREGQVLPALHLEVDPVSEALARLGQAGFVDVDAVRRRAGQGQLVGNEAGRAPDIEGSQARQVLDAEAVTNDRDQLARLLPTFALVEHLGHLLGVGKLLFALTHGHS